MEFEKIKAKDIMRKNLVTVPPNEKVGSSDVIMVRKGVGCLLITQEEKLIGILTNRDIIRLRNKGDIIHKTVSQVMTKNPLVINSDSDLKSIIKIMVTHSIEHLPVLENGKLVGIIGHNQIFRYILKNLN